MEKMEAPRLESPINRARAKPRVEQLPPGHDPVLARCKVSHQPFAPGHLPPSARTALSARVTLTCL